MAYIQNIYQGKIIKNKMHARRTHSFINGNNERECDLEAGLVKRRMNKPIFLR